MEKFFSRIVGMPVVEEGMMRPITTVKDVVIDPENGKLVAFIVDVSKNLVVVPFDILSWGDIIRISDEDAIVPGDDVLRVHAVQKKGIKFFRTNVVTKSGNNLGQVIDFAIDNKTFELRKLYVAKMILAMFRYNSRLIAASEILEILPDKIIVKDELRLIPEKAGANKEVAASDLAMS